MFEPIKEKIAVWFVRGILKNEDNLQTRLARIKIAEWFRRYEMGSEKRWFTSKTLWFNALTGIAGVLVALQSDAGLDPQIIGAIGTILGMVNIFLRLITDKGVTK